MEYSEIRKAFLNPEAIDRSAPFWSWNDVMEPGEVRAQARDMAEKGMGGYFLHSRVGLETEYLGREWMECTAACIDQAKSDGTLAWLYDEDRWPSGAAGGLVTGEGDNGAKGISAHITGDRTMDGEILYSYIINRREGSLKSFRMLTDGDETHEGEEYMHIRLDRLFPEGWFNDTPPADNLNKATVRRFIESTYEAYKKEFGDEFGKAIPGIFTDEPNVASITRDYGDGKIHLAYTYGFDEFFLQKRGYAFSDIIPLLFINGNDSKSAKHDYFRTFGQMFAENFSKQIFDWCEDNGIAFTGHWLAENRMGSYILLTGGILLNYWYQHIPGIDMLREQTVEFMTIKGCASVANQTGRRRMLSETYGVSGWQFSFEGQKWIGDYQYVQGINLRCQHLTWYSMRGCRKRDYPPVFNYQTPWWKYNNAVEDYFARIGALTSKGKPVIDTLVLHPLATGWINMPLEPGDIRLAGAQEEVDALGFQFNEYTKDLMSLHIDFDYGDEDIIAMAGSAENGILTVGEMKYSRIIIPPGMETIYESTLDKLLKFMEGGGMVIDQGGGLKYVEGKESGKLEKLSDSAGYIRSGCICDTVSHLHREVSIELSNGTEAGNIFSMVRDMGDAVMLFMVNNDRDRGYETTVTLKGMGRLEEWDPLNGEIKAVPYEALHGKVRFSCAFGPSGSKIYIIDRKGVHENNAGGISDPYVFLTGLGSICSFERTDENVLVLDMCRMRLDDGEWSPLDEVWRNQKQLRGELGMEPIYLNRGPQRYLWTGTPHENDGRKLEIEFDFIVDEVPANAQLVIEDAENYSVNVNGKKINAETRGWFVDKCMGRIELPSLKVGKNSITLTCGYMNSTELENIYVIGDFGVSPDRRITAEPDVLAIGDWGLQGYFHYHAGMKYKYMFDYNEGYGRDIILDLGKYSDVVTVIRINGHEKVVPWKAENRVQIGHMLNDGGNDIEIELMGAPRNMFGPLHLANSREKWTGAGAFHPEDDMFTEQYITHPWGLMEQVCIYSR